jgi:hypothetical protein
MGRRIVRHPALISGTRYAGGSRKLELGDIILCLDRIIENLQAGFADPRGRHTLNKSLPS